MKAHISMLFRVLRLLILNQLHVGCKSQINTLSNQQKAHVSYDLWSSTANPAIQIFSTRNALAVCTADIRQKIFLPLLYI